MTSEAEHGQADECLGVFEAKGHAGDEPDFGVHGFDPAVVEPMFNRGQDPVAVIDDPSLQLHKSRDPASPGPANPAFSRFGGLGQVHLEDLAECFFQQIRAVEFWVGFGDPGQFGLVVHFCVACPGHVWARSVPVSGHHSMPHDAPHLKHP